MAAPVAACAEAAAAAASEAEQAGVEPPCVSGLKQAGETGKAGKPGSRLESVGSGMTMADH